MSQRLHDVLKPAGPSFAADLRSPSLLLYSPGQVRSRRGGAFVSRSPGSPTSEGTRDSNWAFIRQAFYGLWFIVGLRVLGFVV